jgi:hypothetical protein
MCPFQYDVCHFRNIKGINPRHKPEQDQAVLVDIRRENFDAFWRRASSTVSGNYRDLKKFKSIGIEQLWLTNVLPEMGPFPLKDI